MEEVDLKTRRELIVQFYNLHESAGKSYTVKHFSKLGIARASVYKVLKNYQERGSTERAPGSGRPAVKLPRARRRRLVKAAQDKGGVSLVKLARKFEISKPYVQKVLKNEGVKYYKRKKAPEWTPEKEERQKRCCRRLTRTVAKPSSSVEVVMDDESYFPWKHDKIPGNDGFYTRDKENTPPAVRFYNKKKFEPKLLVWLAISARGHSDPFFMPSRGNMNGEVYRQECVTARLVPFLHKHHSNGDFIFWPDLASCHYARPTTALFEELKIPFVAKADNPPSVPKLRPVEDFWGLLKGKVYQGGWEADSEQQLKKRIKKCLRELDWEAVRGVMEKVKTNLRKAADQSPRSFW